MKLYPYRLLHSKLVNSIFGSGLDIVHDYNRAKMFYDKTSKTSYSETKRNPPLYRNYVRCRELELISEEIQKIGITGAVAELGVSTGEFAKEINRLFPNSTLYLFDTFNGFDERDYEIELQKEVCTQKTIDESNLKYHVGKSEKIALSKMLHPEKCIVKKGYFPETATGMDNEKFIFVSLDCDLYKPMLAGLEYFYPRMIEGGYIMVHDYNMINGDDCNNSLYLVKQAVYDFEKENGLKLAKMPLPDECGSLVIYKK